MSVLDTHESRNVFRRHVEHRTPIWGHDPPYGEVYTCPRCGWKSKGMRHWTGAVRLGERHALECPATGTSRSSLLAAPAKGLTPVLHAEPPRDRGEAAPSMGWPRSEGRAQ